MKEYPIPPADLFMQTGGLVSKPKDGVLVQLDPGWSYIPKSLTKKLLKMVKKNGY